MIVYPEIALKDGALVTYRRGQTVLPKRRHEDPVALARLFATNGAEWIQVVDLDARGRRLRDNTELVRSIIEAVDVPVQVGGGITKIEHVDWWIDHGADSVVIGSAAALNPKLVEQATLRHPFAVVVAIDIWDECIAIEGWTRPSEIDPLDFIGTLDMLDLGAVIVNDMNYEPNQREKSFALASRLGCAIDTPVSVSGLVRSRDDLSTLCHLNGVSGVILARALLDGDLTLADAQAIAWEDRGHNITSLASKLSDYPLRHTKSSAIAS